MFFIKHIKKIKKYVIINDSFTLMEALISIFVMSSIIFLLLNFTILLKKNLNNDVYRNSFNIALVHIKEDIIESEKIIVKKEELILNKYNKDTVTYNFEKNRLVRKVNTKGYEIILSDIEKGSFELENKIIYLNIMFKDEKQNKKEVIYDIK